MLIDEISVSMGYFYWSKKKRYHCGHVRYRGDSGKKGVQFRGVSL